MYLTHYTQTAPGCMFIMFITICYHGWNLKSSIRCWNVSSPSLLFSLHLPLLLPPFILQLSSLLISFISRHLLLFLSRVSMFSPLIVPTLPFSQPAFQGHGIFPWVFTHKIISCWRAGPAVELIAWNADNRDKRKGRGRTDYIWLQSDK